MYLISESRMKSIPLPLLLILNLFAINYVVGGPVQESSSEKGGSVVTEKVHLHQAISDLDSFLQEFQIKHPKDVSASFDKVLERSVCKFLSKNLAKFLNPFLHITFLSHLLNPVITL